MYPINKQAVHNCLIFEMYLLPKHNRYKFVCNSLMQCPMKTRITTYYSDNFTFQCGWCIPWPFSIFNRRHVANILFSFLHRRVTLLFYFILSYFTFIVRVELFLVLYCLLLTSLLQRSESLVYAYLTILPLTIVATIKS